MKQIRRNVFETNSSSSHSVSVSNITDMYSASTLRVDNDNYVHVSFGEFGWERIDYYDPYAKLSYLVTMLIETEGNSCKSVDDLFETDGFKLINDTVANYCKCEGIRINEDDMENATWTRSDGSVETYISHNGYIDHQSCEDYNNVQAFLDDYCISAEDFIFNKGVSVHTDNDNY